MGHCPYHSPERSFLSCEAPGRGLTGPFVRLVSKIEKLMVGEPRQAAKLRAALIASHADLAAAAALLREQHLEIQSLRAERGDPTLPNRDPAEVWAPGGGAGIHADLAAANALLRQQRMDLRRLRAEREQRQRFP